jgi:hypothetical protein
VQLALELVAAPGLLAVRPSLAAAAVLAAGRAAAGVSPFWPTALEVPPPPHVPLYLTGHMDPCPSLRGGSSSWLRFHLSHAIVNYLCACLIPQAAASPTGC